MAGNPKKRAKREAEAAARAAAEREEAERKAAEGDTGAADQAPQEPQETPLDGEILLPAIIKPPAGGQGGPSFETDEPIYTQEEQRRDWRAFQEEMDREKGNTGGRGGRIPDEDLLIEALRRLGGAYVLVAKTFGVSRQAVWEYIERRPHIKEVVRDIREGNKDLIEATLLTMAKQKNIHAVMFFLRTQAKDRGYTERKEVVAEGRGPETEDVTPTRPLASLGIDVAGTDEEKVEALLGAIERLCAIKEERE